MLSPTKKILLLEDSTDLLHLEITLIESVPDWTACAFSSFHEMEKNIDKALSSDVAILDINLGSGQPSGTDAYQWLRSKGYRKSIFFLTGHARNHPEVVQASGLGDAQILEKPFDPLRLLEVIRGAL